MLADAVWEQDIGCLWRMVVRCHVIWIHMCAIFDVKSRPIAGLCRCSRGAELFRCLSAICNLVILICAEWNQWKIYVNDKAFIVTIAYQVCWVSSGIYIAFHGYLGDKKIMSTLTDQSVQSFIETCVANCIIYNEICLKCSWFILKW